MQALHVPFFRLLAALTFGVGVFTIPGFSGDRIVRTFLPADFGVIGNTYSGDAHPNGMIYFANSDGLLEYDGCHWRNIGPQGFGKVISIYISPGGLIYLGGNDRFGYLRVDNDFRYEYFPLHADLDTAIKFQEIWQIVEKQGDIYFQSYEQILKWNGKEVKTITFEDAYIFEENGRLFTSNFRGEFAEIIDDSLFFSKDPLPIYHDAVYSIETLDEQRLLLFSSANGIFEYHLEKRSILPWSNQASSYLKKEGLYHSLPISEDQFIASTGAEGVIFIDYSGNITDSLMPELGVEKGGWREIFEDNFGDIWLCSNFGIVKLENKERPSGLYPTARIRRIISDGKEFQFEGIKKVSFTNRPKKINIRYSSPGLEASHLEFSYFLEGRDEKWSKWKPSPFVDVYNLQGGDYTFYVKSRTGKDLVSEPDQLILTMPLIWYRDPLVYITSLFLFILVVLGLIRFRSLSVKRKSHDLEREVLERTNRIEEQKIELQEMNDRLSETNQELDNFVYRSSHDLTAPLKSIRGLIELSRLEKDSKKYLDLMEESLLRLEDFIQTVMSYSRNNKQQVSMETLNFGNLIKEVFQDLKFIKGANKIEAKMEFENDLNIKSDKRKLNIILYNLVSNAVKYHNYEQKNPYIQIKARKVNGGLKFSVIDNGMGIAPEHKERIFEMFFRASEKSEGSGLGLYIVKEAVEKLNGKIRVISETGKGTRFELEFPQ
jgi:signal transduction histidine kinase